MTRKLSPEWKIRQKIVHKLTGSTLDSVTELKKALISLESQGVLQDAFEEFRSGEYASDITPEFQRDYESKSVAAQMLDGSYIGWTYFYGGGKHSEPESLPWIEDAYPVSCVVRPVTHYEFSKGRPKSKNKPKKEKVSA